MNNASKASTRAASHFLASAASVFVAKATVRVVGLDVWVGNPVGVSSVSPSQQGSRAMQATALVVELAALKERAAS